MSTCGDPKDRTALILSGGAPNAALMAGAVATLHEKGVRFDVFSVSGAGTAVGLLYLVPRNRDPLEALESSVEMGVEDLLFRVFPINFKVFRKPGRLAEVYESLTGPAMTLGHRWVDAPFELLEPVRSRSADRLERCRDLVRKTFEIGDFDERRFAHDVLEFWQALLSPMSLGPTSTGCCAHPPFFKKVVDVDRIKELGPDFYMNSFNLTKHKMEIFSKQEITLDHCFAALAYPFFYPPYKMPNGDYHIEGAAIDALNYKALLKTCGGIRRIVIIDVAGKRQLMHKPRDLFDAFAQSIMTPLIEVARDDTKIFEKYMQELELGRAQTKGLSRGILEEYVAHPPEVLKLPIEMSKKRWERSLDWSSSNLRFQYECGQRAAAKFAEEHPELAPGARAGPGTLA